jgi:hypothetical protein
MGEERWVEERRVARAGMAVGGQFEFRLGLGAVELG